MLDEIENWEIGESNKNKDTEQKVLDYYLRELKTKILARMNYFEQYDKEEAIIQTYIVVSKIHDYLKDVVKEVGLLLKLLYREVRKTDIMREKCIELSPRQFKAWHFSYMGEKYIELLLNEQIRHRLYDLVQILSDEIPNIYRDVMIEIMNIKEGDENE